MPKLSPDYIHFNLIVPVDLKRRFDTLAAHQGRFKMRLVEEALLAYLAEHEPQANGGPSPPRRKKAKAAAGKAVPS